MKKQKTQIVMKYQEAFGLPLPTYERERERERESISSHCIPQDINYET